MERAFALRRIAIIGAGRAGLDFALRCASTGFDVILEDVMPSRLLRAEQAHANHVASGTLRLASTVEDAVRSADLAIDFVPDELESKLEIFSLLDRMAPPHTLLCTPTTALSISDLASCTYRPELCFALQMSSAEPLPSAVHLVRARHSSSEATAAVERWLRALGFLVTTGEDRAEPMLKPARPVSHAGVTP
jgi:3-hydroxybutyryl-CoA dehydrogenase